jgi:phosphoribosylaminoimidazole-succinocarboxamide synthase
VRDWLTESGHKGKAVELPDEVVSATRSRYVEAYERLTGASFDDYLRSA